MKSLQKEQITQTTQYEPQSAGINLQSPQSDSTPWTLTLFLGNVLASLSPLAFYFQFEFPENVCQTMVIITFSLMGVSFILAFTYYIQIFKFAKREQAEFEEALAAAQAAIQASHHTASENGTSINGMYVLSWVING